jgi:hypothetical protein
VETKEKPARLLPLALAIALRPLAVPTPDAEKPEHRTIVGTANGGLGYRLANNRRKGRPRKAI